MGSEMCIRDRLYKETIIYRMQTEKKTIFLSGIVDLMIREKDEARSLCFFSGLFLTSKKCDNKNSYVTFCIA